MTLRIEHEGDLTVFREARTLAEARKRGEDLEGVRPCLFILSGILRGVYGAGGALALERAGLTRGFYAGVGVSTGAPTLAYFVAGQAGIGSRMYTEECLHADFLNLFGHRMNISFLAQVWRGQREEKKLDIVALQDSETKTYISLVEEKTGTPAFVDMRTVQDPIECLVAACSMPGFYDGDATINGVEYSDGAFAASLPFAEMRSRVNPTSILVFMNRPKGSVDAHSWWTWFYDRYVAYVVRAPHHTFAPEKDAQRARALESIRTSGIPYCIVYTDDEVGGFTRNAQKLHAASKRFEEYVRTRIVEAGTT